MHEVAWKKRAQADLIKIVPHIAEDNAAAADQLADDIEAKVEQLRKYPKLFRVGRKRGNLSVNRTASKLRFHRHDLRLQKSGRVR